jgi:CheY-like chemotaxis protein
MKVMLIEDETPIRENIIEMLELKSIETLGVKNGKIALTQLELFLPDIILCDLMMPEMNGLEFLEHLKASDKHKYIPLIFISARAETTEKEKALALGASDFITKPFLFKDIFEKLLKYS